jgi:hypothetical protein
MFQAALLDRQCWLAHMRLGDDGMDPPNIKMRAAQGLEAADYFFPGYVITFIPYIFRYLISKQVFCMGSCYW